MLSPALRPKLQSKKCKKRQAPPRLAAVLSVHPAAAPVIAVSRHTQGPSLCTRREWSPRGLPQPWAVERLCKLSRSVCSGESFAGLDSSAMSLWSVSDVPGRSHGSVATVSLELGRLAALSGACSSRSSASPKETFPPGGGEQWVYVRGERNLSHLTTSVCYTEQASLQQIHKSCF